MQEAQAGEIDRPILDPCHTDLKPSVRFLEEYHHLDETTFNGSADRRVGSSVLDARGMTQGEKRERQIKNVGQAELVNFVFRQCKGSSSSNSSNPHSF